MNLPDGFSFFLAVILVIILASIQFTLNLILKELKAIRIRLGAKPYKDSEDVEL